MKKFNKFGYAGAIALATAMSFSACSSDDEMENINPSYDGSTVKTQFSISLTQKAKKSGRMTSDEVGNGDFKEISDVKLYHLSTSPAEASTIDGIVTNVNAISSFNYQNQTTKLNGNVYDITIPVETSHFLFYGQTAADTKGETLPTYPATPVGATVGGIVFTPSKILAGDNATQFGTAYTNIITTLNAVNAALTNSNLPSSVQAEAKILKTLTTASSEHILALVEDIYNSVAVQYAGIPEGGADKQTVADALEAIKNAGFTVDGNELSWATDPVFPTKYGLPSGAVAVAFDTEFKKVEVGSNTADGSKGNFYNYAKPAMLMYYANSSTSVRNTSYFDMTPQNSVVTEATEATWAALAANFTEGPVTESTRSVIMTKQVNYAVAQLQTKVQFSENQILDSKDNVVAVPSDGFKVTGLLIGNQKQVDWQFKPTGSNIYTIYDGAMASDAMYAKQKTNQATDNYSDVNYTLVYETQEAEDQDDTESDVYVAIEMVNGENEFYGVGGQRVPAGAKFYIAGTLHVGDKATSEVKSVFKQDYITTANFTISSLKNAYNVIPDLSTPSMEFGMSVNLDWQTGLNFDVEIQ